MPRNKAKHKKFQKLEDENGWTHVVRGSRLPSTELNQGAKDGADCKLSSLKAASILSLDQIRNKYSKSQQYWVEDPLRHKFEEIFTSKITNSTEIVIENALVLGLGPVATDNMDSSSMYQLVLFEHWIKFLRTKYTISKIYFQDPHFHTNDKLFLTGQGYHVVDDPEAYLILTSDTLVFAPYLPWQVTHTFLYVCYPVLFIGNNICTHDVFNLQPKRQAVLWQPVVKDFYVSRKWASLDGRGAKESLSGPKHAQWLHDIVIYWPYERDEQEKQEDSENELDQSNATLRKLFEQATPTTQGALYSEEKISFRVGLGEWRNKGYVFDDNLREQIQKIQTKEP